MNKKGAALIISILAITALAIFQASMLSRSISESRIAERFCNQAQSFWLAEAGAQKSIRALNNADWDGWTEVTTGVETLQAELGAGNYTVTVTGTDTTNPVITSAGGVQASQRNITVTMRKETSSPFNYAAYGDTGIVMTGNGETDSYDSSLGAYGGSNVNANGDVGTNGTGLGAVSLSGNATVNGDAGTGTGGTVDIGSNASVTGNVTDDRSETMASVSVPSDLQFLSSSGSINLGGNNSGSITAGDYRYSSIALSGNAALTVTGTVRVYLTDTSAFGVSGNGEVVVTNGASLTIYTDGKCDISGNGITNNSTLPSNLLIYSTYSGTGDGIKISGNGDLQGAIYAPDASIKITGNGDVYGSLIGESVTVTGNGDIHYDEALSQLGGGSSYYVIQSWREQDNPYPLDS